MAPAKPLEEPGPEAAWRAEPAVSVEPARLQSLPAQREPGATLGLPLRGSDPQLPEEMDGPTAVAAPAFLPATRGNVAQAPRRYPELLPDQGALRGRRGYQWQHPDADQSRPRLQEHALSPTQGAAHGRHQHRIPRFFENQKGRVECHYLRIPAESRLYLDEGSLMRSA